MGVPVELNVPPNPRGTVTLSCALQNSHSHTARELSPRRPHTSRPHPRHSNFTPAYSPLRHHLEGTPTCEKNKSRLQRNCLRLLSRVPRQPRRVPVHAQLLRAPR